MIIQTETEKNRQDMFLEGVILITRGHDGITNQNNALWHGKFLKITIINVCIVWFPPQKGNSKKLGPYLEDHPVW